ncbi:probable receptor-like protein kinase At1g80640 isoform X1 [Herrania umbratica]|uniref:Probable receptor-like protein kinase At1g80640 isoform X1 n=2 Tax=Herrania umbratica TaxID=108875 RepID=A0A6J0ZN54_9ROSI|nr:probable receptor-like protein kinase At1g80640 isoform X1 [Herrania umbratica]
MKLLSLLLFLFSLVSIHETIIVVAVSPVSSPISSPISDSMTAFSPAIAGIQVGSEEHKKMDPPRKMLIALILACSSLGAIISSLCCLWIYYRKNSPKSKKNDAKSSDAEKGIRLAPFFGKFKSIRTVSKEGDASFMDYKILEKATSKFHQGNILGEGGFGCVYKAQFDDGSYAAVKKLDCASHDAEKEFENEVDLLCKFKHSNIISLLGYSSDNETRFIVYELMQNGSLETQLHGPSHGSSLTWQRRMKIALDTARGLEYLHEHCNPPVIHRDLKSSNILLDSDFNAKLSDFGLAVTDAAQNKNNLKLSGTLGYVAPEYLLDGKLTDKSDVYAFGVVLLELLLGRKPVEKLAPAQCQSIVTWAMPQLTDRSKLPNIVDPVIRHTMDLKHLYQVAAVAVLCVQPEPSYRPLITDVLHSLIPLVPMELGGTLRIKQPGDP